MGDEGVDGAADRTAVVGSDPGHGNISVTEDAAPAWEQATSSLPQGSTVDRYVIVEQVGAGGMGIVYCAYDPRLDRRVALKVLRHRASPSQSKERVRLLREARALARLSHENVAEIYDVGEHGREIFIALELIHGPTLKAWRTEERTLEEVVAVFVQAGRGLAAAHAAGLVHRDFKPGNAMVDERGRVRVLDFGLAAAPRSSDTGPSNPSDEQAFGSSVTGTDVILGTPAYMAPEQAMGQAVDARADQFSFFVALYEALHGKRPFTGRGVTYFQAVQRRRMQTGPNSREVPPRIQAVIERGLSFDPAERWPSLSEGLDHLDRRRRSPLTIASVVVLGGAVVALAWPAGDGSCDASRQLLDEAWGSQRQRAVAHAIEETGVPYAKATVERLDDRLTAYAQGWLEARTAACALSSSDPRRFDDAIACLDRRRHALSRLTESLTKADRKTVEHAVTGVLGLDLPSSCVQPRQVDAEPDLPRDPSLRSRVVAVQGQLDEAQLAFVAGRYDDSLVQAKTATDGAAAIGFAPLTADATHRLGAALLRSGQTEAGVEALAEAYWLSTEVGHYARAAAIAARLTTAIGNDQQRFDEGLAWSRHGEGALAHLEDGRKQRAALLMSTASIHLSRGQPDVAYDMLHQARVLREELFGPSDARVASALTNESLALVDLNRAEEAVVLAERSLKIRIQIYGDNHPRVADAQRNVAHACAAAGRHEDALRHNTETLRMREAALGPDHPRVAATLNGIGTTYLSLGQRDRAGEVFERAAAIWDRDPGDPNPRLPQALHNLSDVRLSQGRHEDALRHARRSLELAERFLGSDNPALTYPLTGLANVHLAANRPAEALPLAVRARRLADAASPVRSNAWTVYFALAKAQWATGAHAEARGTAMEAERLLSERKIPMGDELAEVADWLSLHPLPDSAPSIP